MKPFTRRSFMTRTAAGAALAAGCATRQSAKSLARPAKPANVVILMSDEHNPRVSSPYGHPIVQTPNMARLAAAGTVFENAYCPSPLCMPSRSAFMAGRYVHELQTYNNCNVFQAEYPSYGQVLRDQGVYTAYAGKVDVYRPGADLGFSEMMLPGDRTWRGDTCIRRTPLFIREGAEKRAEGYGPDDNPFRTDAQRMDAALAWLNERPRELDQPWVLAVNLSKPHFPHRVTQELWDLYPEGGDLPAHGRDAASANHPYARDLRDHFRTDLFSEEQIRGLRRGYLGCVTYVDRQLGRILDALDAQGLRENTIVAYTSDHGEMLGKFGMWWKCSLYEDSARVPLIVAGPGFDADARTSTPVSTLDLQAALFHATATNRPAHWAGQPLQSLHLDDPERPVFAEYHGHGTRASAYLIRKGDWKLIHHAAAPHQLFNLADDPEELTNLAGKHPRKLRELEAHLRDICDPAAENQRACAYIDRQIEAIEARK